MVLLLERPHEEVPLVGQCQHTSIGTFSVLWSQISYKQSVSQITFHRHPISPHSKGGILNAKWVKDAVRQEFRRPNSRIDSEPLIHTGCYGRRDVHRPRSDRFQSVDPFVSRRSEPPPLGVLKQLGDVGVALA